MATGTETFVLGIEIPSTSPFFLSIVGFHVLAGLSSVGAGAGAMLSRKGTPRHIALGRIYYWCLAVLFASASALALVRWAEDYRLFALGALAFAVASFGRWAARRKWCGWPRWHIVGMGCSYIVMLTAFYVDNGKSLPLWRDLPPVAYSTAPAAFGIPLMVWALLRHPLVQKLRTSR